MQLPVAMLGRDVGLDKQEVRTLYQDHAGFVWVGTSTGLYVFDGSSFLQMGNAQGFQSAEVIGMAEDSSGDFWVATLAGMQVRQQGRFTAFNPGGMPLVADRGQTFVVQSDDRLLVVSEHQLLVVTRESREGWRVRPMFSRKQRQEDPTLNRVSTVTVQGDAIWFGCGDGLCRLNQGLVSHFGAGEGVRPSHWQGLLSARDGSLWALGQTTVLRRASGANAFIQQDIPAGQSWLDGASGLLAEDARGSLVIGTKTGLLRLDGNGWRVFGNAFGLMPVPIQPVSTLLTDRDGSLWIGNDGWGVVHWSASRFVENWSSWQGWDGPEPAALSRVDALILWTPDDGELPSGPGDQRSRRWPLTSLPPGQAHMERTAKDGSVWTFHFDGRITRRRPGETRTSPVVSLKSYIRGVKTSRSGDFWIYTQGGIDVLNPETAAVTHDEGLLPGTSCFGVAEDHAGYMWAACNTGIYRHDGVWNHVVVQPVNNADGYESITITPDGRLWVGTSHAELLVGEATASDDLVMQPVGRDALRDVSRLDFLETDARGWLWVGSPMGLDIFDGTRWSRLASRDGLLLDESGVMAFHAETDGSVWINSKAGLSHLIDPARLLAPPAWHAKVIAADYGEGDLFSTPSARFEEGKTLSLRVAVLGNSAGNPVRYRYRLEGVDKDWRETNDSTVSYLLPSSGTFRFEVQAIDLNRGRISAPEAWAFVLTAPWWQSPWAALLVLPIVFAGIVLMWRWRSSALIARTRQLEQIVERRTAQLRAALHARNDLLARISHDLRSPLSNIIECVNRWRAGDAKRDYPRIIEQSVWQQIALIDDLLEFAQDEHAGAELEETGGYLHAFLTEVAAQAWLMAERGSNRFVYRFDERLPILIKADFRRLRQVLTNLLGNAAKFTHEGLVEFDVSVDAHEEERVRVRFTVRDNGIGLASEEIDSLMKPFVRGANVEHREGSGLGLSIVAQWLDRMRSRLDVRQLATGGSEFIFVVAFDLADESEATSNLLDDDPMDESLDGRGRVIVVVDDQQQNRDMICDLLDSYGFASFPAGDGNEALAIIEEHPPAMVITDQYMDGMNGWMLLDALRRTQPDLPVVLCSAAPPRRPAGCEPDLDFDAVLIKPISVRLLLQVVVSRLDALPS
ncbi:MULTISPECIES: ATP-binding protein [unclassified Dyella]|uniref:hybrid sensor histidine kinase/response regulator n=1 Tax=unclassified Dyella TaxID=2634549 RepID=UPI0013043805|nr:MULTISPECIES: ATP-binding protein [unclassified Dyella]MDR3443728.1 ATP-binding protein [Dyella sp.]